jgi:hypothetical protein
VGFACQAPSMSELDPKVGANTTNYLSKWNGSALVASGVYESGGNVGIGTTSPNTALDINGAESMRGMAAPAVSAAGQGRIYFDSTSNTYRVSQNGGSYTNLIGGGAAGSLSGLTAATGTNTIDNLLNAQTWNWSTATTQNPVSINADALTTGSILNLATSSASVNSTSGLLRVANTGASTSGLIARIQSNSTAGSGVTVLANGNVGIGTTTPTTGTRLDIVGTGAAASSIIIPRDTTGNRPTTGVNGMLRYNTSNNKFEAYENGAWANMISAGGGGALSSLTAATGTNTIDNLLNAQTWNWSTATTQTPMTMTANAITTGSILNLATTSASVNSTNGLFRVANTGASTSGIVARIQSNSTASSGLTVLANGNVGIGTTSPTANLDVGGQTRSTNSAGATQTNASAAINWNNGNVQTMSVDCASTAFTNMLDSGTYVLAVSETGTSTCVFAQAGLTFYYSPTNAARYSGQRTVYTFQRIGNDVYVSWVRGFQ